MRALLVKTMGLGPEVEPEVKEIRASWLPAKMLRGIWPRCFSAILVIGCFPSQKPSRAWKSISSFCSSSGPASSTVRPSRASGSDGDNIAFFDAESQKSFG